MSMMGSPGRREEFVAYIRTRVQEFTKSTGIDVTPQATSLIEALLVGFLEDPHPGWKADPAKHRTKADDLVARVPSMLHEIATEAPGRTITTYDVQGWLSRNLSSICPYVCPFQGGAAKP